MHYLGTGLRLVGLVQKQKKRKGSFNRYSSATIFHRGHFPIESDTNYDDSIVEDMLLIAYSVPHDNRLLPAIHSDLVSFVGRHASQCVGGEADEL